LSFIKIELTIINKLSKASKGKRHTFYLLRTVKNRITAAAAVPNAAIGSNNPVKKGSGGRAPLVNLYELFSRLLISSTFTVSVEQKMKSFLPEPE
jgi:hypothetical protein